MLTERASAAGWLPVDAPEAASGGLLLLSRIPISKIRFEGFRFRGDPERLTQGEYLGAKGFQIAELATAAGPLTVINTHLHASYRRGSPFLSSAIRTTQLLQIVEALSEVDGPVVLLGDLNAERGEPDYEVLVGLTGLSDAAYDLGRAQPTISHENHYKQGRSAPDRRVDYVMLRSGGRSLLRPISTQRFFDRKIDLAGRTRHVSDHFGVRAVLELAPRAAAASPRPQPKQQHLDLATELVAAGRAEAERDTSDYARSALGFASLGVLGGVLHRNPRVTRRKLLRRSLVVAAGISALPAVGFGAVAGLGGPEKLQAFAAAEATLASMRLAMSSEATTRIAGRTRDLDDPPASLN